MPRKTVVGSTAVHGQMVDIGREIAGPCKLRRFVLWMLTQSLACGTIFKAKEPLGGGCSAMKVGHSGKPLKATSA